MKYFVFLFLIGLSACFPHSSFDTCDRENERLIHVDGQEKCAKRCSTNADCQHEDLCKENVCVPPGTVFKTPPIEDVGPDLAGDMGRDVMDVAPDLTQEAQEACDAYAKLRFDCLVNECTFDENEKTYIQNKKTQFLVGTNDGKSCVDLYESYNVNVRKTFNEFARQTCDAPHWKRERCAIASSVCSCQAAVHVGDSCRDDLACEELDFQSVCLQKSFPSGYCVSLCTDKDMDKSESYAYQNVNECGSGNLCVTYVKEKERFPICQKGCTSNANCRPNYVCLIRDLDQNMFLRTCLPYVPCTAEACKGRCADQKGPESETISVCQLPCQDTNGQPNGIEAFCRASGGECELDSGTNKKYCVLP